MNPQRSSDHGISYSGGSMCRLSLDPRQCKDPIHATTAIAQRELHSISKHQAKTRDQDASCPVIPEEATLTSCLLMSGRSVTEPGAEIVSASWEKNVFLRGPPFEGEGQMNPLQPDYPDGFNPWVNAEVSFTVIHPYGDIN